MNEKDLKNIKRIELLEMLVESNRRIEELEAELALANEKLEEKELKISDAGNIAEASLALNGVFESAQAAAQQYLDSLKYRCENIEEICRQREEATKKRSEQILKEVREKCKVMVDESKQAAEAYWQDSNDKLQKIIDAHEYLQGMFKISEDGK